MSCLQEGVYADFGIPDLLLFRVQDGDAEDTEAESGKCGEGNSSESNVGKYEEDRGDGEGRSAVWDEGSEGGRVRKMIGFIIGFLFGGFFGLFIAACAIVAGGYNDSDR